MTRSYGFGEVWMLIVAVILATCGSLVVDARSLAALPDDRSYEMVSPMEKNGLPPYAAVPSLNGGLVDFQARGALAGATSGSLNLYQAARTADGWQTGPLTPAPPMPLHSLEEQVPIWLSADLSKTIFTTPASYVSEDEDGGALSLYMRNAGGELAWISQGSQGGSEPNETTFDGATPNGVHVVFSTGSSLLPAATGLGSAVSSEPEYLYERDMSDAQTSLLSIDSSGRPVGYVATTLSEAAKPGTIKVTSLEGFAPGQTIIVGSGPSAETTTIEDVFIRKSGAIVLAVGNPELSSTFPAGTPVVHLSEGAAFGDGGHLTSGLPPIEEYLPADAESGSTTNAIASDGSTVFFESPNPASGMPVGLYMRQGNSTTVKIAGASQYATITTGVFAGEAGVFGSARFAGAAANGSLVFFTSEEGLGGATIGQELYEFNTTGHEIGDVAPLSVRPVSVGLSGDRAPVTTLAAGALNTTVIAVTSTAGFHAGEAVLFSRFEEEPGLYNSDETATIASVDNATQLTLVSSVSGFAPAGTEIHGVHPASVTAIANDGSRVYFVSDGVLAENENSEGAKAIPVQPNLYVYDTATDDTTFIGTLTSGDVSKNGQPVGLVGEPDISRPAVPSPDGGVLVFASAADLTSQNPWEEYTEIYRYAVAGNRLTCLSCTAPGVKPTGNATFGETAGGTYDPPGLSSPMSEDGGRVFFDTPDSLVPEDVNGGAPLSAKFGTPTSTDTYEWEGGTVSLISSGNASTPAVLMGTTPSGDDVLFSSTAQLVPSESDGGYENIFDARVAGGFSAAASPSCVGASCETAFGVAPVSAASAGVPSRAAGHVPSARAKVVKRKVAGCRKGLVRKHVKGRVVCARRTRKAARAGGARSAGRAARGSAHRSR